MYTPLDIVFDSITIKRSIFTGFIVPVHSKEEVLEKLAYIKSQNLNVRHVCYAYILNDGTYKYSDDGEPSGTAGLPIYKTLIGHELTNTLIAVTRVFGGVLLGPGGLGRAYADSANLAFSKAQALNKIGQLTEVIDLSIHLPYSFTDSIIRMIGKSRVTEMTYNDDCSIKTTLPLETSQSLLAYLKANSYQGLTYQISEPYLTLYQK